MNPPLNTIGTNPFTGQPAAAQLVKLRDEARTNTIAFADDDTMIYPIAAGETITWRCVVFVGGNSPGDGKIAFATPAAPAAGGMMLTTVNLAPAAVLNYTATVALTYNLVVALLYAQGGADAINTNLFEGYLTNGVNPGYFSVRTAQNAANLAPTLFKAGSRLDVWKYAP